MRLKWRFSKDKRGKWRWRATYLNGKIAGASSQGYVYRSDCIVNALTFGYKR